MDDLKNCENVKRKELKVFDYVLLCNGADKRYAVVGQVIMLFGHPAREAYVDMSPGANPGYEYVSVCGESYTEKNKMAVELRPLNKYPVDQLMRISVQEMRKYH
ncbi:MAG: hypothetical protein Q7R33_00975 [Nitrosarchaeum sp.]|nr:hypothetical protein [Nitrosarchaeum sp.]